MKKLSTRIRAVALTSMLVCTSFATSAAGIALNFSDASIGSVASAVGAMVGKNVVLDPRVKGNITLTSEVEVSGDQALSMLQSALRMQGFAMIDTGSVFKVIPEVEGKIQSTKVNTPAVGSEIITRIYPLNHENAANVLAVVKPLVTPNNVVNVAPGRNAIVVTDYADNLARIERVIASVDRVNHTELEIIPLKHAIASETVPLLQSLIDGGVSRTNAKDGNVLQSSLMADNRSNSLIVRAANSAKLKQIKSLVDRLDQPSIQSESSAGNLHVVHLKNADAVSMAETLRAAIRTLEQSAPVAQASMQTSAPMPAQGPLPAGGLQQVNAGGADSFGLGNTTPIALGQTLMPSVGGQVQADPNTNSLIITAPAPLYRQLRAVIDKLDSRRAQVLVESMIVEVSDSKLAEFGVQWQTALGKLGAIGTNSALVGGNILNVAAGLASGDLNQMGNALSSLGGGMNLAIAPKQLGQYYLGALANFLQQDGSTNIMSKPNLMTLDNQEARIVIGNNVPFVTGSYANAGNMGSVNPFTTVERKDVGLMLRIKPTINENGTVKLTVSQEASAIDGSSLNNPNGPVTSKRSIESTVLVEDGSIVMLGGLMQDNFHASVDKVPLLGDLPLLGGLFRSENRTSTKSNLMVFLRPVVVRDGLESEALALGRYHEMRALQQVAQPRDSVVLGNVNQAPVAPVILPTIPVANQQPAQPAPPAVISNRVNAQDAAPVAVNFTTRTDFSQ